MKTIVLLLLFFVTFCSSTSKKTTSDKNEINHQNPETMEKIYIGMPIKEFDRIFPGVIPENAGNDGQWSRPEKLYGLEGNWNYTFQNGTLDWFIYDNYIEEINEENFMHCLDATRKLITDYTEMYGQPQSHNEEKTEFIDPMKKRHFGYDVIQAVWQTDNMKFSIEFTFLGSQGLYYFLVKMRFASPDRF